MNFANGALTKAVQRRAARKAIIKDAKGWSALHAQLTKAMLAAWDDAMQRGVGAALDRLTDLGPGQFTAEDGAAIMRQLEQAVGPDAIRAAMQTPVVNLTDAAFRIGAEEVGRATGAAIAFMRPDLDALDILKTGNLYWVGNSWNAHSQNAIARTLETYFRDGMTREGLAAQMAEDFAGVTERGRVYWEMLADHTATKTREMGRVTGYERAGIEQVQVRAHLDERTTKICRDMHGRIIPVSRMRAQRDAYLDAASRRDEAAMRASWAMHGQSADFSERPTSELTPDTASPPYHFRCRTITVAYFGPPRGAQIETPDGHPTIDLARVEERVRQREALGREDVAALVARAATAEWGSDRRFDGHVRRHARRMGLASAQDYDASARAMLENARSDVYLSMRKGSIDVVFARPARDHRGEPSHITTVVGLRDNVIRTHHYKRNLRTTEDQVPVVLQSMRTEKGVIKWLIS